MSTPHSSAGWRPGVPGVSGGRNIPPGPAGTPAAPVSGDGRSDLGRPMTTVASYSEYGQAQRAVDHLSDSKFPVERTAIVGTDLALVETVTGRLTTGRAVLVGAASGAWFGLFIGLLFGIFTVTNWLGVVITAVFIGALWGAIFGGIAHGMTGGRRDFSSASSLRANQYAVNVDADFADQARQLLAQLTWQPMAAGAESAPPATGTPGPS